MPERDELLATIAATALEPAYQPGAARTWRTDLRLLLVALAVGLALGLCTAQLVAGRTARAAERDALLAQVGAAEQRHSDLLQRQQDLSRQVTASRDAALGQGEEADALRGRLATLEVAAGTSDVTGPGLVVVLDDALDESSERGRVLDVDLRIVVNALWQSGAEAVAVNGQRIAATTAIRSAGQAITVNYRSLSRPYRVEAIGDPRTLPARFAGTPGGQWVAFVRTNYGVRATSNRADALRLPAAAAPQLRQAQRKEG